MARRWFKWRWEESRGDENDHWGPSTWLLEVHADSWPLRQIEIYEAGPTLRNGPDCNEDDYGGLGQARLNESENWPQGEITADEFEAAWIAERQVVPSSRQISGPIAADPDLRVDAGPGGDGQP